MERIITYSFNEDFIENLSGFLVKNFANNFDRTAVVFGGGRPALFLKRALAQRIHKAFIPPRFFSIDGFMEYTAAGGNVLPRVSELDAAYYIFNLAKRSALDIVKNRQSFNEFLPWAQEIVGFIEQLDLENIGSESLRNIQKSADIGYEIPENINAMLQHIIALRRGYHDMLREKRMYSRGLIYRTAGQQVSSMSFDGFDTIVFCGFYYLHETEQTVIKSIYGKGKGICVFQGSADKWPVLNKNAERLNVRIQPAEKMKKNYALQLYQGFDMHSQACVVREILKKIPEKDKTLIVVPQPEAVIPLLSEITAHCDALNVSMGYPLKRTSLYGLFDLLFVVQESRRNTRYYARDYLNLLMHPLIKNISFTEDPAVTRVLMHTVEELLKGETASSLGGSLFVSLDEIEAEGVVYQRAKEALLHMNITVSSDDCAELLKKLHGLLFKEWEQVRSFKGFAQKLGALLDTLIEKSMLRKYPLNVKAVEKIYGVQEELLSCSFSGEPFQHEELWDIFRKKLEGEKISFSGSPLRGTQVLGLFETRSLNFKNVIIMDANESVLPKLTVYEPLIPREVMLSLGLNRLEKEEEIQRYQFVRLISGAEQVHLVYEENREKEKSRFIEELIWEEQKKTKKLILAPTPRARFSMRIPSPQEGVKKTLAMLDFLKTATYSASRLNTYLSCPLKFYFQYVLGLKEKDDLLETPEASQVGIFIHEFLEDAFNRFINKKPVINSSFKTYFFDALDKKFEHELKRRMRSDSFLLHGIIHERMGKFLEEEARRKVKKIIGLEKDYNGMVMLGNASLKCTCTIDRIDELADKRIIIIDYKTGGIDSVPKRFKNLEPMVLSRTAIQENIKSFQLPLYYYFIARDFPDYEINAELYSVRTLERKPFVREDDLQEKDSIMIICLASLEYIINELFDPTIPFVKEPDERKCSYCPFGLICK